MANHLKIKSIVITFGYIVAFWPALVVTEIWGDIQRIITIAEEGGTVCEVFKPYPDGYIGKGDYAFTFKGILIQNNGTEIEVVVKFTPKSEKKSALREYRIYTELHAINNPTVESYGIPAIYYFNKWNKLYMMAMTPLDSLPKVVSDNGEVNFLNVLIILREFVRITKYIHRYGIFHKDIKVNNMMFRRNQGFIIDFNLSEEMYIWNNETSDYYPRRSPADGIEYAKNDWGRFLFSLGRSARIPFDLIDMSNRSAIIAKIENIQTPELKKLFIEFENKIHTASASVPFYDQFYDYITEQLQRFGPSPLVSWLPQEQHELAAQELSSTPHISTINHPFEVKGLIYPEIDVKLFRNLYKGEGSRRVRRRQSSR